MASEEPSFTRIVLTGGPCGGKTTALAEVSERLRTLGHQVFVQPEISTLLSNSGAGFPASSGVEYRSKWESERLRLQLDLEDCFERIARASGRPTVLLCDRGAGDAAAYCAAEAWPAISAAAIPGCSLSAAPALMVNRYDFVIHLVSAAIGAEQYYQQSGNSARRETLDEAITVDRNVLNAWSTHPRLIVVDNSTNFAGKIKRVISAICGHLGVLTPMAARKAFFVRRAQFQPPATLPMEDSVMTYTFLHGSNMSENSCLRKKVCGSRKQLTYSRKEASGAVTERSISSREYATLLAEGTDPKAQPFSRARKTFIHESHLFELDDLQGEEFMILQVEVSEPKEHVQLPEWLEHACIRTLSPQQIEHYSLYQTAVRHGQMNSTQ
eukprot:m51a1_g1305 hypothetical protein (383) ;mRNA; r:205705-206963